MTKRKRGMMELDELHIVPSMKDALHIVNSTELDLESIARIREENLKSIYENQIKQSNQLVNGIEMPQQKKLKKS